MNDWCDKGPIRGAGTCRMCCRRDGWKPNHWDRQCGKGLTAAPRY